MKYTLVPAAGHYLLEEYKLDQKMAGGWAVADDNKERSEIGRITKIGIEGIHSSGNRTTFPEHSVGDIVAFKPYTGKSVKIGNETFTAVTFEDITLKLIEAPQND